MVNLSACFPTLSECHNINKDDIALYTHFIYFDKQICIQKSSRSYSVLCFGWKPKFYNGLGLRYDNWYSVCSFALDELHYAQKMFLDLVNELLFECLKPF